MKHVEAGAAAPEPWTVMVLAHNEERRIRACLDSLFTGEPDHEIEVYVMANGCTDATEAITREYATRRPEVKLVSIRMPDKCNAWNVFIHETVPARCPGRGIYFFMDGDARILPGSLTSLARGLQRNTHAHASSAPPASGRSMESDRRALIERRGLVANLYALRGDFVRQLQASGARIPIGLEGDDGLIGALVKWDLDPTRDDFDDMRIEPCPDAGFIFDSVSMTSWREWRGQWRRLLRYGRRRYEFQLLGPHLKQHGLAGMPVHIAALYPGAHRLTPGWHGIYTLTHWIALRDLRRKAQVR